MEDLLLTDLYDINQIIKDTQAKNLLLDYLNRHDVIGAEIFAYMGEKYRNLGDSFLYNPVSKSKFISRIPFYFYAPNNKKDNVGEFRNYLTWYRLNDKETDFNDNEILENLYNVLENLFYKHKIDLEDIFNYPVNQTGQVGRKDILFNWNHYLDLGSEFGLVDEKMPKHIIVAYNFMLEKAGLEPVIYELEQIGHYTEGYLGRNGNVLYVDGIIPCDKNGQPILRWIGIEIKNAGKIWAKVNDRLKGSLYIESTPTTSVYALNCWHYDGDEPDEWYQLYIGPQLMEFDYKKLKMRRTEEKLTQQQVADSIGATLRTYQKWESGTTCPDCRYLLRLMNTLNIQEVQDLTVVCEA